MGFDVEVVSGSERLQALREAWDGMVCERQGGLLGLGATACFDWFEAITTAFEQASQARVVVIREGGEIAGLLPVFCTAPDARLPRLKAPTELYGGRIGLLARRLEPDLISALLGGLQQACPGWASFQITLTEGSPSALALQQWCGSRGHALVTSDRLESPYFPLCDSAEAFQAGITKGLRQLMRTSTNKFKALGELEHRQVLDEGQATELLDVVLAIERQSWKHEAGSAITRMPHQERFYRALFPRALRQGLLVAQVLNLDGTPIAYNFGLCRDGVFSCLKHSHVQAMDKLSPSYLLNLALIDALRARGVHTYDFMGLTDPHKLRWSTATQTYARSSYFVFNRNMAGRLAFFGNQIRRRLTRS